MELMLYIAILAIISSSVTIYFIIPHKKSFRISFIGFNGNRKIIKQRIEALKQDNMREKMRRIK